MTIAITVVLFILSVEINRRLIPALIRWTGGPDLRATKETREIRNR